MYNTACIRLEDNRYLCQLFDGDQLIIEDTVEDERISDTFHLWFQAINAVLIQMDTVKSTDIT